MPPYRAILSAIRFNMRERRTGWLRVRGKPDFGLGAKVSWRSRSHIAIVAKDRSTVDAFYCAALAAGGRDNGPPGLRAHYHPNYYGAFVLDPDGHNIEAVCHAPA